MEQTQLYGYFRQMYYMREIRFIYSTMYIVMFELSEIPKLINLSVVLNSLHV